MKSKKIEQYIKEFTELNNLISKIEDDDDFTEVENINKELNQLLDSLNSELYLTDNKENSNSLQVNIKLLHENAIIPEYSKDGDAGMDLTITDIKEETENLIVYGFGIAVEIPKGYVGLIFSRSSVRRTDLILSNCVGIIDSGYRGEIMGSFRKTHQHLLNKYKVGERAAQILIIPYPNIQFVVVDELTKTDRNDGGFGHTGK